jgi:predicted ATPase
MYIEKIKIVGKSYPGSKVLKKGFEINCADVNLFVGDQGCGKSTLLQLIQKQHSDIAVTPSKTIPKNGINTFYFDSENDNPRVKDPQSFTTPSGRDVRIGYSAALVSRFKSHGEILQDFVITPLLKAKNCIILLDEPESGLSITNQFKLINAIKVAVANKCQFFIATHCYPLIQAFDVISLEHKKQMKGSEFIELVNFDAIAKNIHKSGDILSKEILEKKIV